MGHGGIKSIYLITVFLVIVILLIVVEVNFTWLRPFVADLKSDFIQFQLVQAKYITEKIENLLELQKENNLYLAQNIAFNGIKNERANDRFVQVFLKDNLAVEEISLLDLSGQEIKRYSRKEYFSEKDLRDFSFLEEFESAKAGESYVSRVSFSAYAEPFIILSLPLRVFESDKAVGVLRVVVGLRKLWGEPLETRIGETGRISVVDDKGMLIADPNPSRVLKKTNLLHLTPVKEMLLGNIAEGSFYLNEFGESVVGVGVPITGLRWGVLVEQNESELNVPFTGMERRMYLYLLGAIAVILALIVFAVQLKKADNEVIRRRKREEFVDKIKSEFISVAAHQLRTPLSAVRWILKMIIDGDFGGLNEQQKLYLSKAHSSNLRMINLVNDFLSLSKMEEGKFGFNFGKHNFNDFIKEIVSSFQEEAALGDIDLKLNVPASQISCVFDPDKLRIVFSNLIDNAIRYTSKKGRVDVWIEEKTDAVEVFIKDTGVGIAESQKERIFTKFFRGSNVLKLQTEGSGLGLFLAKNIVDAHNGHIWFESSEGKGTIFHVVVPLNLQEK